MVSMAGAPGKRRRGAALEAALLDAAWAEIAERGYGEFTVDRVASRAGTSKAVLYRRWPCKQDLARAAIEHMIRQDPVSVPDTGSLREDVIAFLTESNRRRVGVATILAAHLRDFYQATETSIADLRETVAGGHDSVMSTIVDRAIARGEADPLKVTDQITRLPADLFRYELLMTSRPVPEGRIIDIVDTIFIPLITV